MWHPALFAVSWQTSLAFWISYTAWFLIEMSIWRRDRRVVSGEVRDRGSMLFIFAMIFVGLTIAFSAPHIWPAARVPLPALPVFWTAFALIWTGIAFRLWAIFTLGRLFRFTVLIQNDHHLVTSGPYRLLRHPGYTGSLMTICGIGLAMGNWISLAAAFACLLVAYLWRIRVEEAALRERFGEAFTAYRRRTWAIIPPVW